MSSFASASGKFKVCPVNLLEDWDELFETYWHSWAQPLQALGELTFPYLGTDTPAERESFEKLKKIYLSTALDHPSRIHWVKCVDLTTAAIIGGACYEVYYSNPYRAGRPVASGTGFEQESGLQALSKAMHEQLLDWRIRLMSDAHILGTALWIIPTYRSEGTGKLIFQHLVSIWDSLNLEAYMEGTVFSSSIALQYGFRCISKHVPVFSSERGNKDDEPHRDVKFEDHPNWYRMVQDIQAHPVSILWRPKHSEKHQYLQGGQQCFPWEVKRRVDKL